ncbi:MAG: hypothetical protein ACETWB_03745, partial [Anaerolineae bacterium]
LADPAFGTTKLLPHHLQKYRALAQQVQFIEWYPIPAILRYDHVAHYFFILTGQALRQINYPLSPPVPSVHSHGYYWTQPLFNIVGIPVSEEHGLLSLPDLFHELSHILLAHHRSDLIGDFETQLTRYFAEERRRVEKEGRAPEYEALYDRVESQWKDYWLSEYTGDMVAAYWVGPAYGWAHLRLCTSSLTDEMFRPGPDDAPSTHPSDESRYRAIMTVLHPTRRGEDTKELEERWRDYVALTGHTPPVDYDLCYSQLLFDALADRVVRGCKDLGLRSFTEQPESEGEVNIPPLLNAAWQQFGAQPETYPLWEQEEMRKLKEWLEKEIV